MTPSPLPQVTGTDATTLCAHFLHEPGAPTAASAWLPLGASIEEVRAASLTVTAITIHTDRGAGELPFEREGKIRRASRHVVLLKGEWFTVDY